MTTDPLLLALAKWSRERGIPKPQSDEGWRVLKQRYFADVQRRQAAAQQYAIGAASAAPPAQDPIARNEAKLNLLRTDGGLLDIADVEHEQSDFGDLVRAKQRAMAQAGGDELAAQIIHRQGVNAELKSAAPFARTNPPSVVNAVLGSLATVTTPAPGTALQTIINSAQQVASWVADHDSETCPVTITFGYVGQPLGLLQPMVASLRPFGIIQFGTRATLMQLEVDIGTGCQLTLSASQVQVGVALDDSGKTSSNSAQLSGMISFNAIQKSNSSITRTRYLTNNNALAPGASGTINVPPFSKNVTIFNTAGLAVPGSDNSSLVIFLNSSQIEVGRTSIPASTPIQQFDMDKQTFQIKIKNNSGGNTVAYILQFDLTL